MQLHEKEESTMMIKQVENSSADKIIKIENVTLVSEDDASNQTTSSKIRRIVKDLILASNVEDKSTSILREKKRKFNIDDEIVIAIPFKKQKKDVATIAFRKTVREKKKKKKEKYASRKGKKKMRKKKIEKTELKDKEREMKFDIGEISLLSFENEKEIKEIATKSLETLKLQKAMSALENTRSLCGFLYKIAVRHEALLIKIAQKYKSQIDKKNYIDLRNQCKETSESAQAKILNYLRKYLGHEEHFRTAKNSKTGGNEGVVGKE